MNTVYLKKDNDWLSFQHPRQIVSTQNVNEVREAIQKVEALVNDEGLHAVGFVSYEAASAFDSALQTFALSDFPLVWFGLYDKPQGLEIPNDFQSLNLNWHLDTKKEEYNNAIQKIKEYIAHGKTYQVNYTMRFLADRVPDSFSLFLHLAQAQNKYAAFIETDDFAICSASPELFFKLDGETIISKPMKGTAKRGRTVEEDMQSLNWLHASQKDKAENVMIVDMIRNDLGKIAQLGSVQVPELFTIEKYSTVFQMTSTVQAKTNASVTKIFSALFPCASITGAPKVSTMKIINELEKSPRKIYTGSIGYIAPKRQARFNVAIRTALIDKKKNTVEYGVGGGIVWDSYEQAEYAEALLKANVLTNPPLPKFSLFETMLWTQEEGFFLLDKHLARLENSARYFDFKFSKANAEEIVKKAIKNKRTSQKVKIVLEKSGEIKCESKDFLIREKFFKVCFANQPVHSSNVFLFHKTTHRKIYEDAIEKGFDEVLLFNEKDELTEFTIGNLVVEQNREFFTPPISCGLLAGTFRQHLIEIGKIKERVIHKNELLSASKVYLINSVRKWVEVEIKNQGDL